MTPREKDAHADLCRRLVTALNERDAARAEVAALRRMPLATPVATDWCGCRAYTSPHPHDPWWRIYEDASCPEVRVDPLGGSR